jgi:organic hydroperoxide reductase OsmC/OhrA
MSDRVAVELREESNYRFTASFPGSPIPPATLDEAPPLGGAAGPNPSRLIGAAVGHCLASSLLFCAQKARVPLEKVEVDVSVGLGRNERGRLRVVDVEVQLRPTLAPSVDPTALDRCKELFEDFCVVTESVRHGVPVRVGFPGPGSPPRA